ncbi:DUF983 domain-containing protein [Novosphingobium sp. Fuku2-ISO-50]|uniref:DUF983 domain-containing protein n=1 Tax=Novosphingobium sp. Fuku2-ISO-50 TaxID=1739114 RepID=UPI00076D9681|nr:DUF983 domain-containing protein [Novosphingobium sp. Fuku2-ISO-50]KUR80433.1 hypothetical protein AQZ50_02840 [Novosphingobium sp. Fuku2-ISO-50]
MTPFLPDLPHSLSAAMRRGLLGKCPRCGGVHLFARFLKPVDRCPLCGQDWTLHAADDFPPYVAILITGHILAPVMIVLGSATAIPMWVTVAIALILAVVLLLSLLQPAKGAIIALQWWMGMQGFAERPGKQEAGIA